MTDANYVSANLVHLPDVVSRGCVISVIANIQQTNRVLCVGQTCLQNCWTKYSNRGKYKYWWPRESKKKQYVTRNIYSRLQIYKITNHNPKCSKYSGPRRASAELLINRKYSTVFFRIQSTYSAIASRVWRPVVVICKHYNDVAKLYVRIILSPPGCRRLGTVVHTKP